MNHFKILTKIYSCKQDRCGFEISLKTLQDILNALTFCFYSYKQVHIDHSTDSEECLLYE